MKKALIVGDGWVANHRHKPALDKLGIRYDVYDIKKDNDLRFIGQYDFALICTPPQVRLNALEMCVDMGIRTVYLEKPLADNLESAKKIVEIIREKKIIARSCHNFLFSSIGKKILEVSDIQNVTFYQLNRRDRNLPTWIDQLKHGIGLDEFPHMGYLSRAMSPDFGLLDKRINYIDDACSSVNKWSIEFSCKEGFAVCDLWRDSFYMNPPKRQCPYWQYKEEWHEIKVRAFSLSKRIFSKVLSNSSNDFGTNYMWQCFISNHLTPQQDFLTSLDLSYLILQDYFALKKVEVKVL